MMFRIDFPIGWSSQKVIVVSTEMPNASNNPRLKDELLRYARFTGDAYNELNTIPGVTSVGMLSPVPFSQEAVVKSKTVLYSATDISPGIRKQRGEQMLNFRDAFQADVSPDGFNVLGIPLIAGRSFSADDVADIHAIELYELEHGTTLGGIGWRAIINQSMAKQLWPGENPVSAVGKIFYDPLDKSHEVVGVVRNYHQWPGNNSFIPTIYAPSRGTVAKQQFLVRFRPGVSLEHFLSDIRKRMYGLELGLVKVEVRPLSALVVETTANQYMATKFIGSFALLGIIVSGLFVYITATLSVVSQNRETGIRMALGAQTGDILRLTLWRCTRAILIGLPFGLFCALILSKILSSVLFQVSAADPFAWTISCVLLTIITVVASLIPTLRASRINPLDVLNNK